MRKQSMKQILCMAMAMCMVFSLMPVTALAEEPLDTYGDTEISESFSTFEVEELTAWDELEFSSPALEELPDFAELAEPAEEADDEEAKNTSSESDELEAVTSEDEPSENEVSEDALPVEASNVGEESPETQIQVSVELEEEPNVEENEEPSDDELTVESERLMAQRVGGVYPIRYELDGGVNHENNPAVYDSSEDTEILSPAKEGYVFSGWYEDAEFSGEALFVIPAGTVGEKTLYARWLSAGSERTLGSSFSVTPILQDGWHYDFGSLTTLNMVYAYVPAGTETITLALSVQAENPEDLNYEWAASTADLPLEGRETCMIPLKEVGTVTAMVSITMEDPTGAAGSETITIFYQIRVDNGLSVRAADGKNDISIIPVRPGESASLALKIDAVDLDDLSIRWERCINVSKYPYGEYAEMIPSDGSEYELDEYGNLPLSNNPNREQLPEENDKLVLVTDPVIEARLYQATVTDRFGNKDSVMFYVYVENHLSIRTESPQFMAEEYYDRCNWHYISGYYRWKADEENWIEILVEGDDLTDARYSVWKYDPTGQGDELVTGEGVKNGKICLNLAETGSCLIAVGDRYHNAIRMVVLLTAEDALDASTGINDEKSVEIHVPYGTSLTLTPEILSGTPEYYSWYSYGMSNKDLTDHRATFNRAGLQAFNLDSQESSYTIPSVTEALFLSCIVWDSSLRMITLDYYIFVDSDLTVVQEQETVTVPYGSRARLQVTAAGTDANHLSYHWYQISWDETFQMDIWSEATGANGEARMTTARVYMEQNYVCRVTDHYGNVYDSFFTVLPDGDGTNPPDEDPQEEQPTVFTICFDGNGAVKGSMQGLADIELPVRLPANSFSRPGYQFAGWALSPDGEVTISDQETISESPEKDSTVTLYAVWEGKPYTVVFQGNGGSFTSVPLGKTRAVTVQSWSQSMIYGETASLDENLFVKPGYTFIGWNTSASGKGQSFADGADFLTLAPLSRNSITLYAQWRANLGEICFAPGGENVTGSMEPVVTKYGKSTKLPALGFVRPGYRFSGWQYIDANGKPHTLKDKSTVRNLTTGDGEVLILTAKWTINTYSITFNTNGAKGKLPSRLTGLKHGINTVSLPEPNLSKNGYVFAGWNTKRDGTGNTFTTSDIAVKKNKTSVTLYATWQYTAVLDANDGSARTQSITLNLNQNVSVTDGIFTSMKPGYYFAGWNTDRKAADAGRVRNCRNLGDGAIVYAVWKPITYRVVFHANNGTNRTTTQQLTFDRTDRIRANSFRMTGHTFVGWAFSENEAPIFTNRQPVLNLTADKNAVIDLYAVWKVS